MKTSKKLLEKLKNVNWKSKKSIIAYAVIFAIFVGGTGTGLALNHFNNSSNIVKTNVKDTSKPADDKTEDKKSDDKKDTDKKAENSKPTDKTEDKKSESTKTDDNKINSSTNKTPVNNNNSNSNNNTGNSSNNDNNTTPTPPINNGGGNSGNNTNPTPPPHTHSWYDLTEPQEQFETVTKLICSEPTCREDLTNKSEEYLDEHSYNHAIKGENGGCHDENVQISKGFIDVVVGRQCACGVKERF